MKIKLNEQVYMNALLTNIGDIFIACGFNNKDPFLAMKVLYSDNHEYLVDLEDNALYTDVQNYYVERFVEGKFVEEN